MRKIISIYLFTVIFLFNSCKHTLHNHNLNFESAYSLFIGRTVNEIKTIYPHFTIHENPGNFFKITKDDNELFKVYPDETGKINAYEIFSDSICFVNVCPGIKISEIKKQFPELPILFNRISQEECFEKSNENLRVHFQVHSNLQSQVVGNYTDISPDKSLNYSFDGYIRSIKIEKK